MVGTVFWFTSRLVADAKDLRPYTMTMLPLLQTSLSVRSSARGATGGCKGKGARPQETCATLAKMRSAGVKVTKNLFNKLLESTTNCYARRSYRQGDGRLRFEARRRGVQFIAGIRRDA